MTTQNRQKSNAKKTQKKLQVIAKVKLPKITITSTFTHFKL